MGSKRPAAWLPKDIADAKLRVDHWRKTREKAGRMPEDLWDVAVRVARKRGINAVAKALNLDYYSLKRHVKASGGARSRKPARARRSAPKKKPAPAFVAVDVTPPETMPECVLELVGPRGVKMTVRLRGAVDVVALAEAFWRRRR